MLSCPTCDAWTVAPRLLCPQDFQEHWSGLPFPSLGGLPHPGSEPRSPALQADSLPLSPRGSRPTPLCVVQASVPGLPRLKPLPGPPLPPSPPLSLSLQRLLFPLWDSWLGSPSGYWSTFPFVLSFVSVSLSTKSISSMKAKIHLFITLSPINQNRA